MAEVQGHKEKDTLLESGGAVTFQPQVQPVAPAISTKPVSPHSFVVLSSLVTIICGVLAVFTLPISIPGLVLSIFVSD